MLGKLTTTRGEWCVSEIENVRKKKGSLGIKEKYVKLPELQRHPNSEKHYSKILFCLMGAKANVGVFWGSLGKFGGFCNFA